VLGAVLALRETFVTSDVSLLARLTALARLGVATGKELVQSGIIVVHGKPTFAGEDHRRDQPLLKM